MKKWLPHLFLALVCAVTVWAYFPALKHVPKHDQIMYLASVAGKEDFSSLAFGTYALNRTPSFCVLDPVIFRPLLYFILGTEQFFFKYHFYAWQFVGILSHLLVVIALYGLLRAIWPGWPAAFSAGFFSLLLINVPLVNWSNIHPYLIFMVLVLFVLRESYLFLEDSAQVRIVRSSGLIFIAVLIYDAGLVFAVPLFLYFLALLPRVRRYQAFWMALPVSVYFLLNVLDFFFVHPYWGSEPSRIAQGLLGWNMLKYFFMTFKWLFLGGIFAAPTDMVELVRTVLLPYTLGWDWPFTKWSPYLLRGGLFLIVCAALIVIGSKRDFFRKSKVFYYLLTALLLSYVLLIVCGRMASRGIIGGPFLNCHYFYFFWLILITLFYAMVDWKKCFEFTYWRSFKIVAVFVVVLMMVAGAFSIRMVNAMVARTQAKPRALLSYVDGIVNAHKNEPDFSFFVPPSCSGNYPGRWLHKWGDPKWRRYTLAEVFYPQYYRSRKVAKYIVPCASSLQ